MLDIGVGWIGPGATNFSQNGYIQPVSKRSTVKELLKMKRQAYQGEQTWTSSQDESELPFKYAKFEAFADDPPAPANLESILQLSPPPLPPTPPPPPQQEPIGYVATVEQWPMSPEGSMTLFHWQIQKEAQKIEGMSPELLNMQDADGDTFLHVAVAQGKRALSYVLAAKMAECGSIDIQEQNGQTALQIAAATNHHLIVGDLLALGAQINTSDSWGRSPLHLCAERGHLLSLQSIWKALTASGLLIDLEILNYDGLTPLHTAVLSHNAVLKETRSLENPCPYMLKELKKKAQMYVECIHTLLLMGASCTTTDPKSGRTCLHMAAKEANVDLLKIFLSQPTSLSIVNAKTCSGNSALHIVSCLPGYTTQVEAVKLLMRSGADHDDRNSENELPIHLVPEGPVGKKVRDTLKRKYFK